jgi:hypothetical protein
MVFSAALPSCDVKTAVQVETKSIYNFEHHNINEGAVDSTGGSLVWEI